MPRNRPVIGISCYVEKVDRAPWVQQWSAVLPHDYVHHVEAAGGAAVILPPRLDGDDHLARDLLGRVDGLILAGGADIESSRYGAPPHATAQNPDPTATPGSWPWARFPCGRPAHPWHLPRYAGHGGGCRRSGRAASARSSGHRSALPVPGRYAAHSVTPVAGT